MRYFSSNRHGDKDEKRGEATLHIIGTRTPRNADAKQARLGDERDGAEGGTLCENLDRALSEDLGGKPT